MVVISGVITQPLLMMSHWELKVDWHLIIHHSTLSSCN